MDTKTSTPSKMGNTSSLVKPIKIKDIRTAIKSLKNGKAAGPDKIPNEFLKQGSKHLESHLTDLFNAILAQGVTPTQWGEGFTHIIYKDKGDITDLSNYRGITVSNSLYKVFMSILNKRLYHLTEQSGILGQIQNGGRKNRRAEDSLMILRTIIDKAIDTKNNELTVLFIDLAKAYDSIPHEYLWAKMEDLGIDKKFIKIVKQVYSDSSVQVLVNGHLTDHIKLEQGIKQGCILSPLLFALYISGMGHTLEKSPLGCKIFNTIISALLYVDDLILIGANKESLSSLLTITQAHLEWLGMNINCDKSNIMTILDLMDQPLRDSDGNLLGLLKIVTTYKYLGVHVNMGKAGAMFQDAIKKKINQLKAIMGQIISLADNSYSPIQVGLALWKTCAIPALLHGIEIISVNRDNLKKLESIQHRFGSTLMGIAQSSTHVGVRKELGLQSISTLIYKRKLTYADRISKMDDNTWVKKAYLECELAQGKTPNLNLAQYNINHGKLKGQWLSSWWRETQNIIKEIEDKMNNKVLYNIPNKRIKKVIDQYFVKNESELMEIHKDKSLKWLPDLSTSSYPKPYLHLSNKENRCTLAKFRLGNTGLKYKLNNPTSKCPACKTGPNSESHLIFTCNAPNIIEMRANIDAHELIKNYLHSYKGLENDDEKLKGFLIGPNNILNERGKYLTLFIKFLFDEYGIRENKETSNLNDNDMDDFSNQDNYNEHNYFLNT